jgi:GT2 family glycosyltransferase
MPSSIRPVVAIVPVALTEPEQLDPLARSLVSLYSAHPGVPIIAAAGSDSDPALLDQVAAAAEELDGELVRSPGSVVAAINAGLRAALEGGADVLLVGQDVELDGSGWLDRMHARRDTQGRPAAIVGARLVHPGEILAEAGLYFSLLLREWQPRLRYAPRDLPAALSACRCPVGTGLQLIRWETLDSVGFHDEAMTLEHANVDLALRVFGAGLECIYEPTVVARRLTPAAPAEDIAPQALHALERSTRALWAKHRGTDLTPWIPVTL